MNLPPTIPIYRSPSSPQNMPLEDILAMPINDREAMLKLMNELGVGTGKVKNVRPHSYWIPYAWMARMIAESSEEMKLPKGKGGGRSVAKAVRVVLRRVGIEATRENENILRVVTYRVMEKPWPPGMRRLLGLIEVLESSEPSVELTNEPSVELTNEPSAELTTEPSAELTTEEPSEQEDADDYIDAELRAELLEEERRAEAARVRAEEERRLIAQMNAARGQDPDADEGYVGD